MKDTKVTKVATPVTEVGKAVGTGVATAWTGLKLFAVIAKVKTVQGAQLYVKKTTEFDAKLKEWQKAQEEKLGTLLKK